MSDESKSGESQIPPLETQRQNFSSIFRNAVCLAPMVRAGSLPFRTLCLKYGADLVYGEEIIDRRLLKAKRVENNNLGTIDFVIDDTKLIFRTTSLEKRRVIFQLGTCDADTALLAARLVEHDVAGVDINMGCPKKFSLQGGMGAALLKDPETAKRIIEKLSRNLSVPVTAKIRIIDSVEETMAFMQMLEAAGASAITVHLRQKTSASSDPAAWDLLPQLVSAVSIPVIANGDVYTRSDAANLMRTTGCSGVMIARPLLLNPSLLVAPVTTKTETNGTASQTASAICSGWKSLREVICDFLVECIKYQPPFQIVKYTIQEMMSVRRHNPQRLEELRLAGLDFGKMTQEFRPVCDAKSLSEICDIFAVPHQSTQLLPLKRKLEGDPSSMGSSKELVSDLRFEDSYFDEKG